MKPRLSQCKAFYKMLGKFELENLEMLDDFALMRLTKNPEVDRIETLVDCTKPQAFLVCSELWVEPKFHSRDYLLKRFELQKHVCFKRSIAF